MIYTINRGRISTAYTKVVNPMVPIIHLRNSNFLTDSGTSLNMFLPEKFKIKIAKTKFMAVRAKHRSMMFTYADWVAFLAQAW